VREATLTGATPFSPVTEFVAVNDVSLFVRSLGAGPDVVALHGGPSAGHRSLLPAFDRLALGRRIRSYDQRGCGQSVVPPHVPLGFQAHLDDLGALLDCWHIERATIIGHSWGALLSLLYGTRNPGRIERMLLVTPAPITAEGRRQYLDRLARRAAELGILRRQRELLRSSLRRRNPAEFRHRAFELMLAPYLKNPDRSVGIAPFRIRHRVREAVWRSLGDYDLNEEVSKLSVPAMVVHGRADLIPLSSSRQIASLLGAQLEIFEDSGHIPFWEEQDRFLAVANEFLPHSKDDGT
jgi:proline iminopeptidase